LKQSLKTGMLQAWDKKTLYHLLWLP